MLIIVILLSKKKRCYQRLFFTNMQSYVDHSDIAFQKKRCYQRLIFTNMQSYVIFETIYWFLHQSIYIHIVIFKVKPCKKKEKFSIENVLPIISFIYHWICSCSVYSNQCHNFTTQTNL